MQDPKSPPLKELEERLPYRLREQFMSKPELSLYRALLGIVGNHYVICPKVALKDVVYIVRPNENVHFFNKIFRKHVDFLLCEPSTLKPAIGVELVKPIAKSETREADQFMEDLFLSAGLPLVHVPSSENYVTADLVELFRFAIAKVRTTDSLRVASSAHGGSPTNAAPVDSPARSHAAHTDGGNADCSKCHAGAGSYTGAGGAATHQNLVVNLGAAGVTYTDGDGSAGLVYTGDHTDDGTCSASACPKQNCCRISPSPR